MKAVHIKIASVMTIAAVLNSADAQAIDAALSEVTQGMPDYFDNEFAVVDIGPLGLEPDSCNWEGLAELFRSHRLQLIAIRNAEPALHAEILAAGLALDYSPAAAGKMPETRLDSATETAVAAVPAPAPEVIQPAAEEPVPTAVSTEATRTVFIDTPVRAGQRIYARGANLIITATVNNGAEIIADGSIHVYGAMRGRVLAGASGDVTARIYASSMQPELVSIAGIYRVFDEGFPAELANRTVQLRLIENKMDMSAVG